MSIPDLLTDQQRIDLGFRREDEDRAKHVRYSSWRYRCSECGLWVRRIDTSQGRQICLKCLAHRVPHEPVRTG